MSDVSAPDGPTCAASGIDVRFGRHLALRDVSIEATAGQVTAVVGGDGAGKTTLLRALVGLVPVSRGELDRPAATRIGYLAATSGVYPDLTVDENLDFAATAYGLPPATARERSAEHLERTGLAPFRRRLAGNLSGGMRQKLGMIRALLHRPDLVVLDEPTTGIDPVSRVDLWWLIARAAAGGAAVVFATTYLDEAERAPRLLVLDGGRPLVAGGPEDIVGSMPGTVWRSAVTPPDQERSRAWRRGTRWRVWDPGDGGTDAGQGPDRERIVPDLQDAVTVFSLDREREHDRERDAAGDDLVGARR